MKLSLLKQIQGSHHLWQELESQIWNWFEVNKCCHASHCSCWAYLQVAISNCPNHPSSSLHLIPKYWHSCKWYRPVSTIIYNILFKIVKGKRIKIFKYMYIRWPNNIFIIIMPVPVTSWQHQSSMYFSALSYWSIKNKCWYVRNLWS